ncbi:prepilin-type N-terminal cleavage/methylation domain-containing protein [Acidisphaera sp. L21]|uniref:prepilin-type N-terminal cleavage/methylation domain-containing protein n=1 Tax=Acidisphaera sp. L21 TaxID=1641851 RepID=UPI00131C900B|nr:prepilin-type N-terminal cleavage/methylation domain-containing protein [Acidisphaera sp. L21]
MIVPENQAPAGDGGFTLLELLVALVVFGFVLAGIAGGVQFGLRAGDMQARRIAADSDLSAADRILRRLIAEMDPGTLTEAPEIAGRAGSLGFITDLGFAAAGRLGNGEAEVGLGVDEGHRLVLHWTPYRHAINLGPVPVPGVSVLLEGVDRVQFSYWGHAEGGSGQWLSAWTEKEIPPLVRIRLTFIPGKGQAWPDIVAATARVARSS